MRRFFYRYRYPVTLLVLMGLAVLGGYYFFGQGQQSDQRRTTEIQIVATANIPAEGQPVRPFAAVDPAVEAALLRNNPLNNPSGVAFLPSDVLPLGTYLANVNPAIGPEFELAPPPPFLNPLDNQLVTDLADIPIRSDLVGSVELRDYGGDGCAPAGLPTTGILTQRFHAYHSGIDIGVPLGTPVAATHSGIILFAGWNSYGYGYLVIILNGDFITYYGHLTNFNVENGDLVGVGSIIGWSGSTGNSTGPHVHYETRINDGPVDPLTFDTRGYANC